MIGAGRLGTALAVLLQRAGHEIVGVSGRGDTRNRAGRYLPGVDVLDPQVAASKAELVLIALPDAEIEGACSDLVRGGALTVAQTVAHVSGALGLAALAPAAGAGARTLALHPLQSFPTVEAAIEHLPGSGMAITGSDVEASGLGERVARDLGAVPFALADEARALYHAAAVFASNYLVALVALAERLLEEAGVEDALQRLLPLARASLENAASLGPASALTGPAARGDAATIELNLSALARSAPEALETYVCLARAALDLAQDSGSLGPEARHAVDEVLARWR